MAEPASICARLLEQWLLVVAGRGGCLRWREASMSYLVSRQVGKPSLFKNNFEKWVFWLHLPLPHPRQQLCVVSATRCCCFARLRSVRSPAWRACAQRPPVLLKNREQMCFGNERWSECGVSAQCKARAVCAGARYALSSTRKGVSKAEEWWMVISTEVVVHICRSKGGTTRTAPWHQNRCKVLQAVAFGGTAPHFSGLANPRPGVFCCGVLGFLSRWWVNDPAN